MVYHTHGVYIHVSTYMHVFHFINLWFWFCSSSTNWMAPHPSEAPGSRRHFLSVASRGPAACSGPWWQQGCHTRLLVTPRSWCRESMGEGAACHRLSWRAKGQEVIEVQPHATWRLWGVRVKAEWEVGENEQGGDKKLILRKEVGMRWTEGGVGTRGITQCLGRKERGPVSAALPLYRGQQLSCEPQSSSVALCCWSQSLWNSSLSPFLLFKQFCG